MTHVTEDQKTAVQQPCRRPYQVPRLSVYGAVRDLTMGGSGNAQETSSGQKPRL